jgi:hypothetical protein
VDALDAVRAEHLTKAIEVAERKLNRNRRIRKHVNAESPGTCVPGLSSRGRTRTYDPLINSQML